MYQLLVPGQLTRAFATDQGIPLGTLGEDQYGNLYRWVKRSAGTLAAKLALTSLGAERLIAPTSGTPTVKLPTADDQPFAGARVSGAESLDATYPYGWVQIAGAITLTDDGTVVADRYVSVVGTSGKVKVAAALDVTKYAFGVAQTAGNDGDAVVVNVPRQY